MMNAKDEIKQSFSLVLNGLKYGPIQLIALVASALKQQKEKIQRLENQLRIKNLDDHNNNESKRTFKHYSSLEELPHCKNNFQQNVIKVPQPFPQWKVDVENRPSNLDSYSIYNTKSTNQSHQKQRKCSLSSNKKSNNEDVVEFNFDNAAAPHPLLGCHCDVCQKLFSFPDTQVYKLESRTTLFPVNCVIKLKNNLIATVSYVGHTRAYKAFISEKFLKLRRPVGVTCYVWQLDNQEKFFSLEDVDYLFENSIRPIPPKIRHGFYSPNNLSKFEHTRLLERQKNLTVEASFVDFPTSVFGEKKPPPSVTNHYDEISNHPSYLTERSDSRFLYPPRNFENKDYCQNRLAYIPISPKKKQSAQFDDPVSYVYAKRRANSLIDNEKVFVNSSCWNGWSENQHSTTNPHTWDMCDSAISLEFDPPECRGLPFPSRATKPSKLYLQQRRGSAPPNTHFSSHSSESYPGRFCGCDYILDRKNLQR